MKKLLIILILILSSSTTLSRQQGETEITTEEGIEVFQNEKYYLLKKNVRIVSDEFILLGDLIKIYFEDDLYDIKLIDARGNVDLISEKNNIKANGSELIFRVDVEEIVIKGENSELYTDNTEMFSNGVIKVNNFEGSFNINGPKSRLVSENIEIIGNYIDGSFEVINGSKEFNLLKVVDDKIAFIKTDNTEMFAKFIDYNKNLSLIELENDVKIIRNGETVTGDYGTLDTNTNSYKIKSNNSKKVKVIIKNNDE